MAVGTLVDSNVLLDVLTDDEHWAQWSSDALATAAELGPLFINAVIYAEVSVRFTNVEDVEEAFPASDFRRLPIPWSAAFLAGRRSRRTDVVRVARSRRYLTSSSARMPLSTGLHSSHVMPAGIARTFRRSR